MSDTTGVTGSSSLSVGGTSMGNALTTMLLADDIQPGAAPSYQLCKTIYLYHPLGQKLAEAPLNEAQSEAREITVSGHPDRVVQQFIAQWAADHADTVIHQTATTSRVYGIASLVLGIEGVDADKPAPLAKLARERIFFNVLDPLNTAGSLVLNQEPNAPDFQKTDQVTTNGQTYHRSRVAVIMHERPVYIAYTSSAFGFVGRSVYQRALFPLKSFIQTMATDDMISRKAGLLIAKMQSPGSIVDRIMQGISGIKRTLLRQGETNQVLSIGADEEITSLNLQNIDGAGGFARTNILKNIATAADMPAVMVENETLTEGFGEGTEDSKRIAKYIKRTREWMQPLYAFMDEIVQYRAWNEEFFAEMQREFPDAYGTMKYPVALVIWRNAFRAKWPSLLEEPESEKVKTDQVKLEAINSILQTLLPRLDPENQAVLIEWAADNLNESEVLFTAPLHLDMEAFRDYEPPAPPGAGEPEGEGGEEGGRDAKLPALALPKAA